MTMSHMQIKELLDENRQHTCEGYGNNHICVRIAAIADLLRSPDIKNPLL